MTPEELKQLSEVPAVGALAYLELQYGADERARICLDVLRVALDKLGRERKAAVEALLTFEVNAGDAVATALRALGCDITDEEPS